MATAAAKQLNDDRRASERALHTERLEWLSAPAPLWACGTPVGGWDQRELLRRSQDWLAFDELLEAQTN